MLRLKKARTEAPDVLEVVHHEIPDTAAGAGAAPIPAMTYMGHGWTWRRMLRAVAITHAVASAVLLTAASLYGVDFFFPLAIAAVLFAGAAVWLPRMSKAGVVYSLVVSSLTLLLFGGLFFGWTGFLYPQSWFEMTFATLATLVPIAGIVAAVATLRHHTGDDAARTPAVVSATVCAAVVVAGLVGFAFAGDATRFPGDLTLTAKNVAFKQTTLTAKAGNVAIYFQNNDPFAHNVHIKGHGGSDTAAGRQAVRHVFKGLTAGTYEYYCTIHPDDMKGTLAVT